MENKAEVSNEQIIDQTISLTAKKRERLFWIQISILVTLVVITAFTMFDVNGLHLDKGIKIIFAPFLSIVPLIFTLTVIRDWIKKFSGKEFTRKEVIQYVVLALLITIGFTFFTMLLSRMISTEILIALIIAVLCVVSFIGLKVKDIVGMAILTGISEGIIVYMVFLF